MSERLIIENFLGLKNIDMEVRDINILIGAQSVGKSVCAKLLYYFKICIHDFYNLNFISKTKREFDNALSESFYRYFPKQFLGTSEFKIRYEIGTAYIEIYNKNNINISYSDIFSDSRKTFKKELQKIQDNAKNSKSIRIQHDQSTPIFIEFLEQINQELGNPTGFYQTFIPSGRSTYSFLHKNIFTFLSNNAPIDTFLIAFGGFYESIKDFYLLNRETKGTSKQIKKILNQLLSGTYIKVREEDYIALNDGRNISVISASSGQQEILPLIIILDCFIKDIIPNSNTLYIEEPEAHVFPTSQKLIVELIAYAYNLSKSPLQFFITTHSPYILTSFNNLMRAGILQKKLSPEKLKKLYKIVPENQIIDPDKVRAYTLEDGKLISLLDNEYKIINANTIDDVSNELGEIFSSLLDMEYE
jgi:predicted ATPase